MGRKRKKVGVTKGGGGEFEKTRASWNTWKYIKKSFHINQNNQNTPELLARPSAAHVTAEGGVVGITTGF